MSMSIFDIIESIQKKPERTRRRLLYLILAAVMFVVITNWVRTIPAVIGGQDASLTDPFEVVRGGVDDLTELIAP